MSGVQYELLNSQPEHFEMTIIEQPLQAESDLVGRITQDLIKFHKEQWRFYETQRQWLLIAVVTFSSVLTASFFSSGAKDALGSLKVTANDFVIVLVSIDICFCVLAALADCKFVALANRHEKQSEELIDCAVKMQSAGGSSALNSVLARAASPPSRGISVTAIAYSAALVVNLIILEVFAFGQRSGSWYYLMTFFVFLVSVGILSALRKKAISASA
jgi:hypothetical protein